MRPLIIVLATLAAAKDLQKLISQMTLDEKLGLLHGAPSNYTGATAAITRLGVPRLLLNDGPQGFRAPPSLDGTSTAFPSGLAVAATFDDALAATWAAAIASEFAKKGATVLLGPGLNVARVPFNGRNFEYCSGEDPYLGARMASAIIPAIQAQNVVATAKHYVLNNQETGRIGADSIIDERTWREMYLPPFESAVAHGALSAMCSYNRVTLNNVTAWACEHPTTLKYLKEQASLFVMSDWLATHSTEAISVGLDQEMPSDLYFGSQLRKDVQSGVVDEATIDAASLNVLRAMQTIGALDRAPRGDLREDVSTPSHRDIARRVAAHAMVLLKNDNILPLRTCAGLVLVGDLQNYTVGGGSGRVEGRTVSLTDAFKTRCGFVEAYADLQSEKAQDAVATATNVLVVTGSQSTEGADRSTLALDGEAMIEAAAKLNPSIIVACAAPGAFLTGWRDTVQAILTTWPGGQELAHALVDVLFGDVNPSGRLPLTLPMTETDLKFTQRMYPGLPDPNPPKGCADPCLRVFYDEKLEVGYRRYDSRNIEPAYAFGHGRSYTSFVYGNLTVSRTSCTFDVRNIGGVAGAEVAQLYVVPPSSNGYQQLKGFHKTAVLAPGRVERVTLRFDARTFSAFLDGAWRPVPGADRGSCAVEHFVRHLQTDGSGPAVLYWQGGVFLPRDDDHKKRVPAGSSAKQSCGGKWVVDSYSSVGAHSGDFGGLLVHLRRSGFEVLKKGSEKLFHEGKGDPPRPDMSEPELPRRRLARHHPAAGLHRLWGLCWAHAYLGVLSRALRREALIEAVDATLPKRMGCEAALCDRAPTCLTSMRPRVGHALEDAVVDAKGWGPREDARWAEHPMGYIDRKVLFSSSASSGEATFAIDVKTSERPLVACEAPCPWGRCPAGRLPLKGNVRWTLDGEAVTLPSKPPASLKIYDVKDTCHVVIGTLAAGRHVVGLTFAPPPGAVERAARGRKTGAPYAGLTHLIFY